MSYYCVEFIYFYTHFSEIHFTLRMHLYVDVVKKITRAIRQTPLCPFAAHNQRHSVCVCHVLHTFIMKWKYP